MTVKSFFEFKFPKDLKNEGLALAKSIGNDMPPLDGYLSHEVIEDSKDPARIFVNTHWSSKAQCDAVLTKYNEDPKIKKANEMIKGGPVGFVGLILSK